MTLNKLASIIQPLEEISKINEIIDELNSGTTSLSVSDPFVFEEGVLSANIDTVVGTNADYLVTSGAVETAINNAIVGGVQYVGTWTATNQTDYSSITLPVKKGYLYYVEGSATINEIDWNTGDYLLVNANVSESGTLSDVKKIDNTESNDLVKLDATQILTNKTLDADDNTITDLTTTNLKSGVLQTEVRNINNATNTNLVSEKAVADALATKQGTLIAGNGITISNNTISLDANVSYTADCPALTPENGICTWEVTHNLGTTNLICSLFQNNKEVAKDVRITSANSCTIRFNANESVLAGSHKLTIISTGASPVQYKASNVVKHGAVTDNNGIISNFSENNYLTLPYSIDASVIEIGLKIKTAVETVSGGQKILVIGTAVNEEAPLFVTLTADGLKLYAKHCDNLQVMGSQISITNNTVYYIKFIADGTNISFYMSETDYNSMTLIGTQVLSESLQGTVYLGYDINNTTKGAFAGKIDLNECYININNSRFWSGVTQVGEDINSVATTNLLEVLYPVGSLYFGTMSICPLQALGVGTWQLVAADRVIQGAGTRGVAGASLSESLPNIKGEIWVGSQGKGWGLLANELGPQQDGAFYTTADGTYTQMVTAGTTKASSRTKFSANKSSSIYQDNAHVQQDAYLVNIWERIA